MNTEFNHQAHVKEFLQQPQTYGLPSNAKIQTIETHASWIFLAGDKAYKLKKAVKFPYLDFSTLDLRKRAIEREYSLNQKFSPSLYLGIAGVYSEECSDYCLKPLGGGKQFSDDNLVEPLVVMRRFPQDAQLDRIVASKNLTTSLADQLGVMAALVIENADKSHADWSRQFRSVISSSLEDLKHLPESLGGKRIAQLEILIRESIAMNSTDIENATGADRVRRCHGDLHLGNIYVSENKAFPFDALEFDENLATIDVLYELAFLLMDLIHTHEVQAALRVQSVCVSRCALWQGVHLLPLYCAVRALIRAVVTADLNKQHKSATLEDNVRGYLETARKLLEPPPPGLICIGGLSGTGKTTQALRLAEKISPLSMVIRSDMIRKISSGVDIFEKLPAESYTPEASALVYDKMLQNAQTVLRKGTPVILDAVFGHPEEQQLAEKLASDLNVPFHGFWLELPLDERIKRISGRQPDASDADRAVAEKQEQYDRPNSSWQTVSAQGSSDEVGRRLEDKLFTNST